MRRRVSAVIINEKKLLLVKGTSGFYSNFYFTPGGKVEKDETDLEAIKRECEEELGIKICSSKKYLEYKAIIQGTNEEQTVVCYVVQVQKGDLNFNLGNEVTKSFWYSRKNYYKNSPQIAESIYINLVPALIKDNLL